PTNDATQIVDGVRSKTLSNCHALVDGQKLIDLRITRGCADSGSQSFSTADFIPRRLTKIRKDVLLRGFEVETQRGSRLSYAVPLEVVGKVWMFGIGLPDPLRSDIQVGETLFSYVSSKFFCGRVPESIVITHGTSIGSERPNPRECAAQWPLHSECTKPTNPAILANQNDP